MENKANQNRKRGKRFEKEIAKRLGGTRVGLLGKTDVLTDNGLFAIECKSRKVFAGMKFLSQAKANAPLNKIPVVIIHLTNQRHTEDIVMLSLKDWLDLHGG